MTALLETTDLVKSFGQNTVLRGVNLGFHAGEVTALLGANGAGKSTLLACISGAEAPSGGSMTIGGARHAPSSPREAIDAGVAMIYQHFQLIESLTIADNVFLGSEIRTVRRTVDRRAQERETLALLHSFGLELDPTATIDGLSMGERQVVEIVRSLRRDPQVLILDEPTAALSRAEADALLGLISDLARNRSIAVIYVTHLLPEVMQVADRFVVLRDGDVYKDRRRGEIALPELIEAISPGRAPSGRARRSSGRPRPVVARLTGFAGSASGPLDVELREGEVLGVFGLLGCGRTNLLETLAGVRHRRAGRLELGGVELDPKSPAQAAASGVALVPADRESQALYPDMSAADNVMLPHMKRVGRVVRSKKAEKRCFEVVANVMSVRPPDPRTPARALSGGNAQKLMIGRWTNPASRASLLLLDEPTQGVDVGAREDIYAFVRSYVDAPGRCAVFSTSEYEEAAALADRVVVLHAGKVTGIVDPDVGEPELMRLAFGNGAALTA
ncbi:MAG: sugar ABC transporter ATP-binding protein [Bifidobacteriaceae bacterium]|nr:sugar ABC transporter ATP-binding protein [Bifidobacteriaceae bacterium]